MSKSRTTKTSRPETDRVKFTTLLAANPNYFGNLSGSPHQAVKKIISSQRFESLACIGFNPNLDLVEATVRIEKPTGYKGDLCSEGSTEYIRFYLSYDNGATWEDVGLVAVNVHDIDTDEDCAGRETKPLTYVLTQKITPRRGFCGSPILPLVRGILSWEAIPPANSPDYLPVWGNRHEQHIQIKPRSWHFGDLGSFLSDGKLPSVLAPFEHEPLLIPEPAELQLGELAQLYQGSSVKTRSKKGKAEVEPERFGFSALHGLVAAGSVNLELLPEQIEQWSELGLSWPSAVDAFGKLNGNTTYEQVECLGLDYNRELLSATFRIKRPTGYLGDLCRRGSTEYVAFWADWEDTCEWDYLGTVKIQVHDIARIPEDGLSYSALLKVNLDSVRRPCKRPRVGRVRAVLSWNVPPSTTDANAQPFWGNHLDAHVLIKPGQPSDGIGGISVIGGIPRNEIHVDTSGLTEPEARFALQGTLADNLGRQCPFGGRVVLNGPPVLGGSYRIKARSSAHPGGVIVLDSKIRVVDQDGVGSWSYPDADGYFAYLPDSQNFFGSLAYFESGLENGIWEVQLQVLLAGGGSWITQWYKVRLDNTKPTAELTLDAGNCEQFTPGTPIAGRFVARDPYFGRFSLRTLPNSAGPNQPSPPPLPLSTDQTSTSPGDPWELDTHNMAPCGYVMELKVSDRTIKNSGPGSHNHDSADVGFCLINP